MTAMNINKEKAIKLINLLIIQKDSFTKIKKNCSIAAPTACRSLYP